MSPYLLWGLLGGATCVLVYISIAASGKNAPELGKAIELIISAVGVSAGVKICRYVLTGQLSASGAGKSVPFSEEDLVYFAVGGFALSWISIDTIFRSLAATYRAANPPPPPPPAGPPPQPPPSPMPPTPSAPAATN